MSTPNKQIRLDMPFYYGLQNFIFMPDGSILWTTASQTPCDKIKTLINKEKYPKMAHSSIGKDMPHHGQWLRLEGDKITWDIGYIKEIYDLKLNYLRTAPSTGLHSREVYKLEGVVGNRLQGIDYAPDTGQFYTTVDNLTTGAIDILKYNEKDRKLLAKTSMEWSDYDRSSYKNWEAEGIRIHPVTGEVWIGINFATKYGTHKNYITKINF